jgi:hypothetical protein
MKAQPIDFLTPGLYGFDSAAEFQPHGSRVNNLSAQIAMSNPNFAGSVHDYLLHAIDMIHKPKPDYALFKAVMTGWDNTPRRQDDGGIFINSGPEAYEYWLSKAVEHMIANYKGDERMVFINAWNEWAEGAHLEPDRRYGRRFLEATRNVLRRVGTTDGINAMNRDKVMDGANHETGIKAQRQPD